MKNSLSGYIMKKTCTLLTLALLFSFCLTSVAQEQPGLRERADRFYGEYQYANASKIYLKLADHKNPRLQDLERLADCYRRMNNYEDAENWYARVIADPKSKPENLMYYAEVLKANSRYDLAKKAIQDYAAKTGDQQRLANDLAGCDSALVWMAKPTAHQLKNEFNVNTGNAEFSTFLLGNKVYYTAEPDPAMGIKTYGWTGNSFLRVYTAERNADHSLSTPGIAEKDINNENYHIGPVVSNQAGNVLYITRTYPGKGADVSKEAKGTYRTSNLELFIQKKVDGKWQSPEAFAYNNVKSYSLGHASLSADEKTLYFVSDMPGGIGGTDIWSSVLKEDGTWAAPVNLGAVINTAGNEMFPSVDAEGTLFYSTNGLPGMGGLDIFSSSLKSGLWSKPKNLGYPLNSAGDDFAFVSMPDHTSGYLSSNRKGGKGSDDIYSFTYRKPGIILALAGITYDKKTGQVLPVAIVTLYNQSGTIVNKQATDAGGTFFFELEEGATYKVHASKAGFYADSSKVSTLGLIKSDTLHVALYLNPLFEKGKILSIENIHYNFDKDDIRPDAARILTELVRTMRDNPGLKIELGSHTDSRGVDVYNLDLSQRRAQSVVNFLVSHGIARDRMKAKGYGETRLLNHCSNNVKCSEAAHQANRRTEFTILEY